MEPPNNIHHWDMFFFFSLFGGFPCREGSRLCHFFVCYSTQVFSSMIKVTLHGKKYIYTKNEHFEHQKSHPKYSVVQCRIIFVHVDVAS